MHCASQIALTRAYALCIVHSIPPSRRLMEAPMTPSEWRAAKLAEAQTILADAALCSVCPSLAELANLVIKKHRGAPIQRPPHRPRPALRLIDGRRA
jgi:hypothetical protein